MRENFTFTGVSVNKVKRLKNMEKIKVKNYQIWWHNLLVADTIKDAVEQVDGIRKALEPLLKLEQEGRIKGCFEARQPSIQGIEIIQENARKLVEQNPLVSTLEIELDEE